MQRYQMQARRRHRRHQRKGAPKNNVTMEYGLILPHPGGETEWFAENADALDGIQGTGL